MKKILLVSVIVFYCYNNPGAIAQTLTPQVIASAGSYQSNATASLSYTIGETNIQTLASANNSLTQGFQQPYIILLSALNLKLFIEGYYLGGGLMQPVLFNTGLSLNNSDCDSITIELHDQFSFNTMFSNNVMLNTSGLATVNYPNTILGGNYYIVVRTRNTIETWSKLPVTFNSTSVFFDFSSQ